MSSTPLPPLGHSDTTTVPEFVVRDRDHGNAWTRELVAKIAHDAIAAPFFLWAAIDATIAFCAMILGHRVSPSFRPELVGYSVTGLAVTYAAIFFVASYMCGLYGRQLFNSAYQMTIRSLAANVVAAALTTLTYTWVRFIPVGRWVILCSFIFSLTGALALRLLMKALAGRMKARLLLVGDSQKHAHLADQITRSFGELYEVPITLDLRGITLQEKISRTVEAARVSGADEIIVEDDSDLLFGLLSAAPLIDRRMTMRTLSAFHEDLLQETPVDNIDFRALIGPGWGVGRQSTEAVKRAFDVVLSLQGLLLTSPLLLLIAIAVKLTSRGDVLYRQTRVGRFGRPFEIIKFRSMRADAEADGAVWAASSDHRTTLAGRFLRRTHLDELPQLWNVLRGDMSFVGPRPERPEFVAALEKEIPHYALRHLVPPGVTGWAQIRFQYGASISDAKRKLAYDLYYVRRYGVAFDIAICLKTVIAILRG